MVNNTVPFEWSTSYFVGAIRGFMGTSAVWRPENAPSRHDHNSGASERLVPQPRLCHLALVLLGDPVAEPNKISACQPGAVMMHGKPVDVQGRTCITQPTQLGIQIPSRTMAPDNTVLVSPVNTSLVNNRLFSQWSLVDLSHQTRPAPPHFVSRRLTRCATHRAACDIFNSPPVRGLYNSVQSMFLHLS